MKHFLLAIIFLPLFTLAQNIYTVSNVAGTYSNFKTLQGAHDSVPSGSILYVLPSSNTYGDVIFSKKLTVYGTGYFLGQNLAPNTQANTAPASVNSITFRPGSDNSFIEGLNLSFQAQENTSRIVLDTVSNITISRCLIVTDLWGAYGGSHFLFVLSNANNCLIKQSYIQNNNGYTNPPLIAYTTPNPNFSGIQFLNNIFDWNATGSEGLRVGPNGNLGFNSGGVTDATFTNNTFLLDVMNSRFGQLNFFNNIFVHITPTDLVADPNQMGFGTAQFNVTNAAKLFPTPGNNFHGANTDSMFVGSLAGYHSIDQKWIPRDTSFVNTFGQGGIACGAFGGNSAYVLSGIPAIPHIYSLTIPSQATTPGTISVKIKATASN